jgi:hypothetical protein
MIVGPQMFFQTDNADGRIPSRNSPPPSASELASLRRLAFFYLLIGALDLLGAAGIGLTNLSDPVFRTIGLAGSAIAVLLLLSGWSIRRRRFRTFSFLAAYPICLGFPVGTVIGIWTIILLSKPAIRQIYEYDAAQSKK